jgi:type II secretory pathway pseudopilin PulG
MSSFQAPNGTEKKGLGCWAIGGIGCLVALALFIILFLAGLHSYLKTQQGQQFLSDFKSSVKKSGSANECEKQMSDVFQAIQRYHQKNGQYPKDLAALTPNYLTDPQTCHCSIDPVPNHQTLVYTYPGASPKPSQKLLSFTWSIKMMNAENDYEYYYDVSGQLKVLVSRSTVAGDRQIKLLPSAPK